MKLWCSIFALLDIVMFQQIKKIRTLYSKLLMYSLHYYCVRALKIVYCIEINRNYIFHFFLYFIYRNSSWFLRRCTRPLSPFPENLESAKSNLYLVLYHTLYAHDLTYQRQEVNSFGSLVIHEVILFILLIYLNSYKCFRTAIDIFSI